MMAHKFKMTEIGPIPEEWELRRIDTSFDFVGNNTFARESMLSVGEVVNIHYGDVLIKYGANVDVSSDSVMFLDSSIRTTANHALQSGDIVMADTAEDETAGKCCEIIGAENKQVEAGLHTFVLRPRDKYAPKFLGYAFNAECYHNQLIPLMQGTKVTSISKGAVGSTFLICPSYTEQESIANALSDIDNLIRNLQSLIAKKLDIKRGVMQQLLSGNKRLRGFTKPWVEKKLGEITPDIYQPETISQDQFTASGYPVYGANGRIGYYDRYNHETEQILVTCRGSSCGSVNFTMGKCWITGNAMVINLDKVIDKYDKYFLFYLLVYNDLTMLITGSGQPQIVRKPLLDYTLCIPPTLTEQTAISSLLSSMGNEIEVLESKKAKYESIKQGMMQELLTGKIRLL